MAQPPAYNRDTDFARNAGSNTDHNALNAELDRASNSINDIRTNLSILQADDGRLRPDVVTSDSINQELIDSIASEVYVEVQDDLDRAEAAAIKAEADGNRAEAAANSITDEVQRSEAAAATATARAGEAVASAKSAQAAAQEIKDVALVPRYAAEGTADALVVRVNEHLPYKDLDPLFVRVVGLNTNTTPTIQFIDKDGGTSPAYPIIKGSDTPLAPGDMTEDHIFQFNESMGTNGKFALLNPTTVSGTQAGGLPIGAGCWWMGANTPKDFLDFRDTSYSVNRVDYPEFVDAVWCGDAYNLTADFFYRTSDAAGLIRNSSGDYLQMPIGDLYFMRGRDTSGVVHPYKYQADAMQGHMHNIGSVTGASLGKYFTVSLVATGTNRAAMTATTSATL